MGKQNASVCQAVTPALNSLKKKQPGETAGKISKNADTSEKGSETRVICKNSRNPVCNFSNVQLLYLKGSLEAAAFVPIPQLPGSLGK